MHLEPFQYQFRYEQISESICSSLAEMRAEKQIVFAHFQTHRLQNPFPVSKTRHDSLELREHRYIMYLPTDGLCSCVCDDSNWIFTSEDCYGDSRLGWVSLLLHPVISRHLGVVIRNEALLYKGKSHLYDTS